MSWVDRAACRDTDPYLFHCKETIPEAVAICGSCPVIRNCADARELDEVEWGNPVCGVWGGVWWIEEAGTRHAKQGVLV